MCHDEATLVVDKMQAKLDEEWYADVHCYGYWLRQQESHTNQSITIMGDSLGTGVQQQQRFMWARQRKQQQTASQPRRVAYI